MTSSETITPTTEDVSEADSTPTPTTDPMTTSETTPGTTTEGEESSSESGSSSDSCGNNKVCLGAPPLGWTGPVVVAKGQTAEDLPNCKDPYPGNEITRFEGFSVPGAAECECACELSGATCSRTLYHDDVGTSCFANFQSVSDDCVAVDLTDGNLYASSYVNFGASCDQQAEETIPEIPWDAVVKGCTGGVTDEVCDDNSFCYKKPDNGFEEQICYIAEGDIPCPPNTDFQDKTIRYSAVQDTRDCTSCQCGQLNSCLTEYDYFASDDCSGAALGSVNNASCTMNVTAQSVSFDVSNLSCPVLSESEPEGEATPLDGWTYCCADAS